MSTAQENVGTNPLGNVRLVGAAAGVASGIPPLKSYR